MSAGLKLDGLVCFNFYSGWREVSSIYKDVLGKDITPQKVYVLESCDLKEQITMQELSIKIDLDTSAVSTLVSRMEKSGLLKRTHGVVDRRKVFVQLTDQGVELREQLRKKYEELLAKINHNLSSKEVDSLIEVVKKLKKS